MNRILFYKEWRQHGPWFFLLFGLAAGIFFLVARATNAAGLGGGAMYGVGQAYHYVLPICSLILANLLIATEFRLQTQLFLEGLPLPRWRMLAMKFALAYGLSIAVAWIGIAVGVMISSGAEALSSRYLAILLASGAAWAVFVTGFFLVIGFLGRYRIPICLALFFFLIGLINNSQVPVGDFPPFLVASRFGFEREIWPVGPIVWAVGFGLLWLVVAFALGLAREGSVASMLGEKMSHREKMVVGGVVASIVMAMIILQQPKPAPFALPGAIAEEWDGVRVFVSPEDRERSADADIALAVDLAKTLAERRDWLGIETSEFPPVYVIERTDLEDSGIDPVFQDQDRICLVYADYQSHAVTPDRLAAEVLALALSVHTMDRSRRDNRWWITRGVLHFWYGESDPQEVSEFLEEHDFDASDLKGWRQFRERVGEGPSDAVAGSGMRFLEETYGEAALQAFVRATITHRVARRDSRASWWELFHPPERELLQATDLRYRNFNTTWRRWLDAKRSEESS